MRVHQLLPVFSPGDAMGAAALGFQRALRRLGLCGDVFAGEVKGGYQALVRPASALAPARDDLVLYHLGVGSPLAGVLSGLRCRRGLVFHNITPARLARSPAQREALLAGRAQLAALAGNVELCLAVSRWNAREAEAAGHAAVQVVPLFVEPGRFGVDQADARLLEQLRATGQPRVLFVGRLAPHKGIDRLLDVHEALRARSPQAQLLLVGSFAPGHAEVLGWQERGRRLGGVHFLGHLPHAGLVAAYHAAQVFLSASQHEGFGVPLVEAFAAGLPVVARGAAAVPETMGGRGLVVKGFAAVGVAALVEALLASPEQVERLVEGQRQRAGELSLEGTTRALEVALRPFLPRPPRRSRAARPRVGLVVQRFGEAILGGAEAHARAVALRLAPHVDLEVLTTTSVDHLRWDDTLPPGRRQEEGLWVSRHSPARPRALQAFNRLSRERFAESQDLGAELHWLAEQGPQVPTLLEELARRGPSLDACLFFTALYAPTVLGLPLVHRKALLVPTVHDEPPMRFGVYADALTLPRALLCNSPEEADFIARRFPAAARRRVVGVGIDALEGDARGFQAKLDLPGPYLLYLGRLEAGKGLGELLEAHQALVRGFHDAPTLVLAGRGPFQARGKRVREVGYLDEADKWSALRGALAVVVPGALESLSLLALEAFTAGVPVLGNARSEVVAGHVRRSGAGALYSDEASFTEAVRRLGSEGPAWRAAAARYARTFSWEAVVAAYLEELEALRMST